MAVKPAVQDNCCAVMTNVMTNDYSLKSLPFLIGLGPGSDSWAKEKPKDDKGHRSTHHCTSGSDKPSL